MRFFRRFEGIDDFVQEYATVRPGPGDVNRLPPGFELLAGTSVGIAGLGSLGSKVAASLARTGVGRFYLVDDDLYLPENAVRHALDLRCVGGHKSAAVADVITCLSPHAAVEHAEVRLGGQESSGVLSGELGRLASCDVIVDATADPQAFNLLAAAAQSRGKALLWAQVFAGGIGGFVARSRPGVDPPPHEVRRRLGAYSAEHPAPDAPVDEPYAALGWDGEVHVASDADVTVIAGILTELVLDTLLARQPSRYPHSLYLVGLARAWVFSEPLHVIPIEVGDWREQPAESPPAAEQEAGLDFIKRLISGGRDASHPAP